MTLTLHYHPFSSYCQKVLVALYERGVPFERNIVDLGDAEQKAALERLWPMGKFPVLRDEARGATVPESSLIVEYLDRAHPEAPPLVPADPDEAMQVHLWDRFFDHYVETPLQKAVIDCFRPEGARDPQGVDEARNLLRRAWDLLEAELADGRSWVAGGAFSLADCGAGPALFYANIIEPFGGRRHVEAYYARLLERPSFARAVDEARPYRAFFPLPWPEGYA
jgi:glutathione S-transferase